MYFRVRSAMCGATVVWMMFDMAGYGQRELYPTQQGKPFEYHLDELPRRFSFHGELRNRMEDQTALNLREGLGRYYTLTRVRAAVDFTPAKWFRGQLEFQDTHALGLPLRDTAANQRDQFDFFLTYGQFLYKTSALTVGRQIVKFGDERVVGASDWTNNSRTWDGANVHVGSRRSVDVFASSVVLVTPTSLDKHGPGLTFYGAHGRLLFGKEGSMPKGTGSSQSQISQNLIVEPFFLTRTLPRVRSQQGLFGAMVEETFGSYFQTALPYGFSVSGTGDLQRGSFSNDSIHAGSGILRGGWIANAVTWKPHIEGEYNYATGNTRRNPGRISTFDQQYPSNHNAFGLVDLFGFQNIKQDRLNVSATPIEKVGSNLQVLFQVGSLHLATVRDAVYASGGTTLQAAPTRGFRGDGIGTEFDASAKYIWRKSYVANLGVGHLFTGTALTSTGRGSPLTLAYLQFTYRFNVSSKPELEAQK